MKKVDRRTTRGRVAFRHISALLLAICLAVISTDAGPLRHVWAAEIQTGVLAVAGAGGARLYEAPGGELVATLPVGTTLTADARTADGLWVSVATADGVSGWAEVAELVLFGLRDLPIAAGDMSSETMDGSMDGETPVAEESAPTATVAPPTATRTATPEPPSPTPTPSSTATPVPATPTAPPSAPVSSVERRPVGVIAVVRSGGTGLRSSPDGDVVAELVTGTALSATGRSQDSLWLHVMTSDGQTGWVGSEETVIFDVDGLPVVDAMPAGDAGSEEPGADEAAGSGSERDTDGGTDSEMMAEEETASVAETETGQPSATRLAPPEVEPTATPTPAATRQTTSTRPTPVVAEGDTTAQVELTGSRLNIRSGPGTGFDVVAKAYPDETFIVLGRNAEQSWIEIDVPDVAQGAGWVSAEYVRLSDPIVDLPVTSTASIEPTATPTAPADDAVTSDQQAQSGDATSAGLSGNIVFQTKGSGEIYVYNLDSGSLRFLTGGYDPEVSKDGSTVTFTRYGERPGIYSIKLDGSDERFLFGDRQLLSAPKWSPDGEWIVFSRAGEGYKCYDFGFGICISDDQVCPGFSCLPSELRVTKPEFELSRIDRNGDNYRDLNALTSARAPDWNEAGILYDASTGLELTQDEGDARTAKIIAGRYYQDADWAPNGGRIVFQVREGDHYEIFAVNPDGTGLAALTGPVSNLVEALPSNVSPAWSPDGRHVVYLSSRDANNSRGDWRIWVMDAGGGNQRPLPIDVPIEYGFAHEQMVSWGS